MTSTTPNKKHTVTSYTLNDTITLEKLQHKLKKDGVVGRWRMKHENNTGLRTFWSNQTSEQPTQQLAYYEHDMISLIISAKIYGVMQASIADMVTKVQNQTPKQQQQKQKQTSSKKATKPKALAFNEDEKENDSGPVPNYRGATEPNYNESPITEPSTFLFNWDPWYTIY